jgi:hypothetical protein
VLHAPELEHECAKAIDPSIKKPVRQDNKESLELRMFYIAKRDIKLFTCKTTRIEAASSYIFQNWKQRRGTSVAQ